MTRKNDLEAGPVVDGSDAEERELDMGIDVDGREATFESPEGYKEDADADAEKRSSSRQSTLHDAADPEKSGGSGDGAARDAETPPVRSSERTSNAKETRPAASSPSEKGQVKDPNEVGWDGPDDPLNPHNWTMKKKWTGEP